MEVSSCCQEPVEVGGIHTTRYYYCSECGEPCDIILYPITNYCIDCQQDWDYCCDCYKHNLYKSPDIERIINE